MISKSILKMTPEHFMELPPEDQLEFLETCKADFLVVNDLIRDRATYRKVVQKLTKQLESAGLTPVTNYDKESNNERIKRHV